jgi:hypothetical protein
MEKVPERKSINLRVFERFYSATNWLMSRMMEPTQSRPHHPRGTAKRCSGWLKNAHSIWTILSHHSQVMEIEGTATCLRTIF